MLREIVRLSATNIDVSINFVDETCDDVSSYIVLSHLIRALPPVFSGGSIHPEVSAVVEGVGLAAPLGIGRIYPSKKKRPLVLPFKMRHRHPPRNIRDKDFQLKPQAKEDVSDAFCDTLNEWLEAYDLELTPDAEQSLVNSINESLDNAERHGIIAHHKLAGDWSIAGFSRLEFDDEGLSQLRCSFAIVSVGTTIAETLSTGPEPMLQRLKAYQRKHGSGVQERDSLLATVFALQDGVTRIPDAAGEGRGGVGLMELVNIFADLGDNHEDGLQSVFTIISGKSCLRITTPYRRGVAPAGTTLKELWFNEANDRNQPPSDKHAFSLDERFAGTILAASFVMDRDFMKGNLE